MTGEATQRSNTAPSIERFEATPQQGVAPFVSTLSFAVSDAERDATTCTIDVFGDGTLEVPSFPCGQSGKRVTINDAGPTHVVLTATDAFGATSAKTISVTGVVATAEIKISRVEWGQTVVSETPRLVAGKAALLRVHVLGDRPDLGAVAVEAEVRVAQGVVLGKVALKGPASPPTAEQPATLDAQWTGVVSADWVLPGMEVRIKADAADAFAEADEANNLRTVQPAVGRGTILPLTLVPVITGGVSGAPFEAQSIVTRIWPVKSVDVRVRAPYTFSGSLAGSSTSGWGTLLQELANIRHADGSSRYYYGLVKVPYRGGVSGIGYVGMGAAMGRDDSPGTLVHELGHNMGRNHAPCGGVATPDQKYPYPGAKIGSWGWDYEAGKLLSPTVYFDLMAYCAPDWVSDYNYRAVQQFLEAEPEIGQAPAQMDAVLVAGVVRNGQVRLRPLQRLVATRPEPQEGATSIRLKGVDGTEVSASVVLRELGDHNRHRDLEHDERHFTAILPDIGELASAEVLAGGVVLEKAGALVGAEPKFELDRLDASSLRLRWTGARTASIAHISASGERTTLGLWLEGGEANIRVDGLTGGQFEVGLSDGLNSTRARISAD